MASKIYLNGDPIVKKTSVYLIIFLVTALFFVPVPASGENATSTTTIPTTEVTITASPTATPVNTTPAVSVTSTTQVPLTSPTTNPLNATPTVTVTNTTPVPTATTGQLPNATTTTIPTVLPTTQSVTGNLTVTSSPFGASILIDGVYYGTTPGNITGLTGGNHIIRLAMSGYYDYEGTIYVVPGQVINVFGALPPLSGYYPVLSPTTATTVPTHEVTPVTTVQPTQSSGGLLDSPTVVAAIIGIITAIIGAGATIFTHYSHVSKGKKE